MKAFSTLLHRNRFTTAVLLFAIIPLVPALPDVPAVSNGVAYFSGNQSNGIAWPTSASVPSIVVRNLTTDITPSGGTTGINLTDSNHAIDTSLTYHGGIHRIETSGDMAAAMLVSSGANNGNDGDDGYFSWGSYYDGEDGDDGKSSGDIIVFSTGELITSGTDSQGILAQSRAGSGGDGGNGYEGNANDTNGGDGGAGGNGGSISISGRVSVATSGEGSHGIHAQSMGGSGGKGGTSYDNSGYGGKGATGGDGGTIGISGSGTIETSGNNALGILAESIGGSGGKGGAGRSHAEGQYGGRGGDGGEVFLSGNWQITTRGDDSAGIQILSSAGTGGDGGKGYGAGGLGGHGNRGGAGGNGGYVTVTGHVDIVTYGDNSAGISAQSHAGDGGDGGDGYRYFAGSGSAGGQGGTVLVGQGGRIVTHGIDSAGIFAESLGGDGGNGGEGFRSADGGNGGTGGHAGGVTVNGTWDISTTNEDSSCIVSRSIGGTGGDGDESGSRSDDSGHGKKGGDGGMIALDADVALSSLGNSSIGILALSQGGHGGDGGEGFEGPSNDGTGGNGGAGGNGGDLLIGGSLLVVTSGDGSYGMNAQSRGGTGGNGGATYENGDYGGKGAVGGSGGMLEITASGTVDTSGSNAIGIYAESIGGTGGKGGDGDSHADGEYGGTGGNGGNVLVGGDWTITTHGNTASALKILSTAGFGGDGGNGGDVLVGDDGDGNRGGNGGLGGRATVTGNVEILTFGDESSAIIAQSSAGAGGDGGYGYDHYGGQGGTGGRGGAVTVEGGGSLSTMGKDSLGILALSQAGNGGDGGEGRGTANGGDGSSGGEGGAVSIAGSWDISTYSNSSHGISARSIGGAGGLGGDGGNAVVGTSVGGIGGAGGNGGSVLVNQVSYTEDIIGNTQGNDTFGIMTLSVGGSGGDGGNAGEFQENQIKHGGGGGDGGNGGQNIVIGTMQIAMSGNNTAGISSISEGGEGGSGGFGQLTQMSGFGGDGGNGGSGGNLLIDGNGYLTSKGTNAYGIFTASSGGNGGSGGSTDENFGGDGGNGGEAGQVGTTGTWSISMQGHSSTGLMLRSIGGNGSAGGEKDKDWVVGPGGYPTPEVGGFAGHGGHGGAASNCTAEGIWNITTQSDESLGVNLLSRGGDGGSGGTPLGVSSAGGDGGDGGHGGYVSVSGVWNVTTQGDRSSGIICMNVGGTGGNGGDTTQGLSGNGGDGGHGGNVSVDGEGSIAAYGTGSHGILALSRGGDGGSSYGLLSDDGVHGNGGEVMISGNWNISTHGAGSSGIVAQSIGKDSGDVGISISGNIHASGENSTAIFAESSGDTAQGNIAVTLLDGEIIGGTGSGIGVLYSGGANNTLTNFGTVGTMNGAGGTAVMGTPNNESIYNGGVIIGSVDLNGGSNVFNNATSAVFHSGSTLYLGTGNRLVNAGTLSPGGLTTILTGDYIQTTSGVFQVDLNAAAGSDQLVVDGTVTLDGTISILNGGGAYTNGMSFDVLVSSNALVNAFSSTNLPTAKPLLYFGLEQESDRIKVKTTTHSFESVAKNRLERSVGRHLDTLIPTVSGDLLDVMAAFQNADADELSDAFRSLGPSAHDATTRAAISAARQAPGNLQRRMTALPSQAAQVNQPTGASGPGSPMMGIEHLSQANPNGLWINGVGLQGEQDGEDGFSGYDYRTAGLELGYERIFQKETMAGASIDYASTAVDIDQNGGDSDIESIGGALYAARYSEGWYVDGILRYANQEFDTRRNVLVGSTNRTANSSHSGNLLSGSASVRYDISKNAWKVGPLAALQYLWMDEEGYSETGAGGANQIISGRTTDSLTSELGVRVARTIETKHGSLIPAVQLGWLYDYDIGDRTITTAFEGAPDTPFTVDGQHPDQNGILLGLDLRLLGAGSLSGGIEYDAELRDHYSSHSLRGYLYYSF